MEIFVLIKTFPFTYITQPKRSRAGSSFILCAYDTTEHPMMLATNKDIRSKEDVIAVAKQYFSRWAIMQISA